jgi:hypothetical protein
MVLKISVEEALTRVVRKVGGRLVSELLPIRADLPKNADFVFPQHHVVAELKRLEKDQSGDPEMGSKIQTLYRRWLAEGKRVPIIYGRGRINVHDLPLECAHEMISLMREPIARRIRKANDQIKSTKAELGMPDALGLLFLAQDGDYALGPETVFNLASRCLKGGQFRSVNDIIHFNANLPASRPNDSLGYLFWFHACRNQNSKIPDHLIQSLSDAWRLELEEQIGPTISLQETPNIDTLRFRRPFPR